MSHKLIIFAHIPKTAGTSLREAVRGAVPAEQILQDYGRSSRDTSTIVHDTIYQGDPETLREHTTSMKFLFSHFHDTAIGLRGYRALFEDAQLCTILRDPIQRIVSEYFHFRNHYNYAKSFGEFIREPKFVNRQSKSIGLIPLCAFDFVGITEHYPASLKMFSRLARLKLLEIHVNRRPKSQNEPTVSNVELDEFVRLNVDDIALYNEALYRFAYQAGSRPSVTALNRFEGSLAPLEGGSLRGWAVDYASFRPAVIEVVVGDRPVLNETACLFRPDVKKLARHLSGYCGFCIPYGKVRERVGDQGFAVRIQGGPTLGTIPAVAETNAP